ncbi:MAG: carboxymuconolactone decarboxylase family protein [Actinobacteria bacterium]|nr:carboxymuconolactone decarboxylase family protein [Actinomycetota bacterium]
MTDTGDVTVTSELYERAKETMRSMWGEEPAEMLAGIENDFNRDVYRLILESCFGLAWRSDDLDPKTRSLITVAICAALGRPSETKLHLRFARRNGASEAEIREMLKHVVTYAGAPAGGQALSLADEVLAEEAAHE